MTSLNSQHQSGNSQLYLSPGRGAWSGTKQINIKKPPTKQISKIRQLKKMKQTTKITTKNKTAQEIQFLHSCSNLQYEKNNNNKIFLQSSVPRAIPINGVLSWRGKKITPSLIFFFFTQFSPNSVRVNNSSAFKVVINFGGYLKYICKG